MIVVLCNIPLKINYTGSPKRTEKMVPSFITDLFIMMVMSRIQKSIDFNDWMTLFFLRTVYILSVFSAYMIYILVKRQVLKKNDTTKFKIMVPQSKGDGVVEELNFRDYDMREADKAVSSLFKNAMIILMIHMQLESNTFLFKQIPNPVVNALFNDVVRFHWFGAQIERPFTSKGLWQFITRKKMPVLVQEEKEEDNENTGASQDTDEKKKK